MAEVVKELEEKLNCLICLGTYTVPKLLQCNHVFCRDCLDRLAHRNQQGLPCPTCRQVTPIPPEGVAGLQSAFQTNQLLEILDKHEKVKQDILYCQQHQNRELELYCETCEELICVQCTIKQHNGHKYNLIGEVFEKHKKEIMSSVNKSSDEKLGTPIRTIDLRNKPQGIAFNQSGEVVVASPGGNCVSVFSPSGDKLRSFGTEGSGQGQFMYPGGVAVDGEGNILVADCDNHRIQKFTAKGQFLTAVGTKGSRPLQFNEVEDIAINTSNNKVYVVDHNNHRIQVLNSDLTFSNTFGKYGKNKGEFNYPYAIACDSTGNVYVADSANNRVQVFTSAGKFLRMFGSRGKGDGDFNWPCGVALDVQDKVYVSDDNHRISVFTSGGQFMTSFGSEGRGPGEFKDPRGLAVDSNGVVYVCDRGNYRLQLF